MKGFNFRLRKIREFWKDVDSFFRIPTESQINYLEFKDYPINSLIFNFDKSSLSY